MTGAAFPRRPIRLIVGVALLVAIAALALLWRGGAPDAPAPRAMPDEASAGDEADPVLLGDGRQVYRSGAVPSPTNQPAPGTVKGPPWPEIELVDADTGLRVRTPDGLEMVVQDTPGSRSYVGFHLAQAPSGYVVWDGDGWNAPIGGDVRAYRGVLPLRREADVRLRFVLPPETGDADRLTVGWEVGGTFSKPFDVPLSDADTPLRGVPFVPGEHLRVCAHLMRRGEVVDPAAIAMCDGPGEPFPADVRSPVVVTVVVPPLGKRSLATMDGNAHGEVTWNPSYRWRVEGVPIPEKGTVVVRIRRLDGRPAAGVPVLCASSRVLADGEGVARFMGISAGDVFVRAGDPGFTPISRSVALPPGGVREVDLVEPAGVTLEVEVRDENGGPAPYARVAVGQPSGLDYADVDDGVQRIDPFTDVRGRRTFHHVEPGRIQLTATFGRRLASVDVEAVDGTTVRVTLVLVPVIVLR